MKRGRKSKAEKDQNFISRVLDTKAPWPWKSTTTLFEIERSFFNRLPITPEVTLHYLNLVRKERGLAPWKVPK